MRDGLTGTGAAGSATGPSSDRARQPPPVVWVRTRHTRRGEPRQLRGGVGALGWLERWVADGRAQLSDEAG